MSDTQSLQVNFNPDLFNNLYWHLEEASNNSSIRYIWVYGGSSASKTFSEVQLTLKQMLTSPNHNTMVMRKVSNDIKDSIFADFKGIMNDWEVNELYSVQQNLIKCSSGSYTRFRGLDDSEKVKGLARFKKVILEEVNQFDEADFKQIRKRLRGAEGQQIISIFNPISEEHWIKKNVFDKDEWIPMEMGENKIAGKWINKRGNSIMLLTNYMDNKYIVGPNFVDQHVIDDFEWDKTNDYAAYEVYGLGLWGRIVTGGEFYKNFKREHHVGSCPYDPKLPLHISFDENVNPYFPCGIFQIRGKQIWMINEILAKNPNNTVDWICKKISTLYAKHEGGMFIYGDATSQKDDVKLEKGHDLFTLIMDALKQFKPSRRTANSNPSVVMRGNFINAILKYNFEEIEFKIDDSCKGAIEDFEKTKEDADGRKDKKKVMDKVTQISYQPFGHITDLTDYLICFAFASEYSLYKNGGKPFSSAVFGNKDGNTGDFYMPSNERW